ncbi:MAG: zf-HC2 domain-containing protein [Planctomycetes bacterium]|nr:zf-HC2 domain-containing protein [Planctomycetota bacterium]MCC7169141.1 zf-HC2 domain-containing protein [Planctomycetota bacterium]
MSCQRFMLLLHDYFVGTLQAGDRDFVDDHAGSCRDCGALMAVAKEISCEELVEFLNLYVDGELPADRRAIFERHLAICAECLEYLRGYRETMRVAKAAHAHEPEPMPPDLLRAILAARNPSS